MTTGPDVEKFMENLKEAVEEESDASNEYQVLARVASSLGHPNVTKTLKEIAEDESRHHTMLSQIVKQLSWAPEFMGLSRPFPQIYDDWADLGIDIGAKDPSIADEVHTALTHIYTKTPEADEAKRWIIAKANELGVT